MDEKMIPYFSHEGDMARMERSNRRLWVIILVLIAALIITNGAWIYYENQFTDEVSIETKQDVETGDGDAFVNGIGDINYGTSETNSEGN